MNNNLLQAVNFLVDKKKVEADVVFDALEMVLLTAYKRKWEATQKLLFHWIEPRGSIKFMKRKP